MRGTVQKWLADKRLTEMLRFSVNGGISFLVDYGVLYALTECAGVYYLVSSAISFTASVTVNYVICVRWVFKGATGAGLKPKLVFVLSSLAGLGINQLFMWSLVDFLGLYYMLAKIVSTCVVMIWNYIMKRKALHLQKWSAAMSIAVLIPCYNESMTIGKVVRDFKHALPEADIYVYDNNSTDGTDEQARQAGAIVRYERRQGKGNVIRTMFREIHADCYLLADGDDTYPAAQAREMADLVLTEHADMVIGDRLSSTYFTENKRRFHGSGNLLVRTLVNRFFHGDVEDILTGYRTFSHTFVKSFPVLSKGFEIETEMTIHALDKNFDVRSVPVSYRDRPAGSASKLNTYSDGLKVMKTIFRLLKDYKPLQFFSALAGVLLLLAVIFATPVFIEFSRTGMVPRFPTLIVAGFAVLSAILLFCCGLILDTESKRSRQYFEIQLNLIELLWRAEQAPQRSAPPAPAETVPRL